MKRFWLGLGLLILLLALGFYETYRVNALTRPVADAVEQAGNAAAEGDWPRAAGLLQQAHALCRATDTLTLVDEIQSCAWYPEKMLFRRYGLQPDFVVVGKGFPGGENSGSKILCTRDADNLVLFGALITNGQEELTNLSYLITMRFIEDQAEELRRLQSNYDAMAQRLAAEYPHVLTKAVGLGYLAALQFTSAEKAGEFAKKLSGRCIDTSAQLYKANCPPAALFKLPIVMQDNDLAILEAGIRAALEEMQK